MAERRMLHRKVSVSADLAALDRKHGPRAVLFYTWLIPHLDRWGCVPADVSTLLGMVGPLWRDVDESDVKRWVAWMVSRGLLERVTGANRERGLRVPRFHDHQAGTHFEREAPSRFEPDEVTQRWKRDQSKGAPKQPKKAPLRTEVLDESGLSRTKSAQRKGREGKKDLPPSPSPSPPPPDDPATPPPPSPGALAGSPAEGNGRRHNDEPVHAGETAQSILERLRAKQEVEG